MGIQINPTKNITVYLTARLSSQRAPRKMIRPFTEKGESLFEVLCQTMQQLRYPCFTAVGDDELIEIGERMNLPNAHRTRKEVDGDGNLRMIYGFLERCETSHAMIISPCTPFLTPEVINDACDYFCKNDLMSLTSVTKEQNWFFGRDKKPLFEFDVYNMNSKDLCLYAMANAFEIFSVERFLKDSIFYEFNRPEDPYLYEIPKIEAVDINDADDFQLASLMWRGRNNTPSQND
jgi:CMP-N-acetylneuraminic acid synthetase